MAVEHAERIYSSYSGVYDYLFDTILQPGRRRAIEALAIRNGDKILEVGVGTGLSLPLYPSGCRVTGIDISAPMLEKAAEKVEDLGLDHVDLQLMSADRLEWSDGTFDKVLLPYVITCVEHPDRVIREVHRVCRTGGRILFLGHFRSTRRPVAWMEKRLTPLTIRLGFVLDLPMETVIESGLFEIVAIERVNLLGLWSLVTCLKR